MKITSSLAALATSILFSICTPTASAQRFFDGCQGLDGYYAGTCVVNGQPNVTLTFTVQSPTRRNCLISNSNYLQSTPLLLSRGIGYASPLGQGVALRDTRLEVYGGGHFKFTGYNYAGNFNFTCSN